MRAGNAQAGEGGDRRAGRGAKRRLGFSKLEKRWRKDHASLYNESKNNEQQVYSMRSASKTLLSAAKRTQTCGARLKPARRGAPAALSLGLGLALLHLLLSLPRLLQRGLLRLSAASSRSPPVGTWEAMSGSARAPEQPVRESTPERPRRGPEVEVLRGHTAQALALRRASRSSLTSIGSLSKPSLSLMM